MEIVESTSGETNGSYAWSGEGFREGSSFNLALGFRDGQVGLTLRPNADVGRWTSPIVRLSEPLKPGSRLIPWWQTRTPKGSGVSVSLQPICGAVTTGGYDVADWALHASPAFPRTSKEEQEDDFGLMKVDTWVSKREITGYRVVVDFFSDGFTTPRLVKFGVLAAPKEGLVRASETILAEDIDLPVPELSQDEHRGEFREIDDGGINWCNSTSTAMMMGWWGVGPNEAELNALAHDPVFDIRGRKEPEVVHAALHTFDSGYQGTGNWSFAMAYAGEYGLDTSVQFFSSLESIVKQIKLGRPVGVSLRWPFGGLPGAARDASKGHIAVVRGFKKGRVIVNDPATHGKKQFYSVRREYDLDAFSASWNGIAYVATL